MEVLTKYSINSTEHFSHFKELEYVKYPILKLP